MTDGQRVVGLGKARVHLDGQSEGRPRRVFFEQVPVNEAEVVVTVGKPAVMGQRRNELLLCPAQLQLAVFLRPQRLAVEAQAFQIAAHRPPARRTDGNEIGEHPVSHLLGHLWQNIEFTGRAKLLDVIAADSPASGRPTAVDLDNQVQLAALAVKAA